MKQSVNGPPSVKIDLNASDDKPAAPAMTASVRTRKEREVEASIATALLVTSHCSLILNRVGELIIMEDFF